MWKLLPVSMGEGSRRGIDGFRPVLAPVIFKENKGKERKNGGDACPSKILFLPRWVKGLLITGL